VNLEARKKRGWICLMNVLGFSSGVRHLEIRKDRFTNGKGLFAEVKLARHLPKIMVGQIHFAISLGTLRFTALAEICVRCSKLLE